MKKITVVISMFCFVNLLVAGEYFCSGWIDIYSPDGRTYFRGLTETTETRGMFSSKGGDRLTKNNQVYDLQSGDSWKMFPSDLGSDRTITSFEFPPPEQEDGMLFRRQEGNFRNLDYEKHTDGLIIVVVRDRESGDETIYLADTAGKNLRKLAKVPGIADWHLDHKYMKLRVFSRATSGTSMKEYNLIEN